MNKRLISMCLTFAIVFSMFVIMPTTTAQALTQEQQNIVARADELYGVRWMARSYIQGCNGHVTYSPGEMYNIPYGKTFTSGKCIGYDISIADFLMATNDMNSAFYTSRATYDGKEYPFYCMDDAAFVSYCWGIDRTLYIPSVSTHIGNLWDKLNELCVGDALYSSVDNETILVTDVVYEGSKVKTVELTLLGVADMTRFTVPAHRFYTTVLNDTYEIFRFCKAPQPDVPKPEVPKSTIKSALDEVSGGVGTVNVSGWSFDSSNKSVSTEVHIYIGGPAGSGEGKAIKANVYRPDVDDVYGCGDYHGFNSTITTTKRGKQPVYVYAISADGKKNELMGGAPKYVTITENSTTNNNPISNLEILSAGENTVRVKGWTFDKDDTSKSLEVHVYVGGEAGSSNAKGYVIKANINRPDVNNAYGCGSNHGFDSTIVTDKIGSQPIYVYAINVGSGSNVCIGNKTLTITDTTKPVVSNVRISKTDANNFTVSCTVKENALSKVHIYAWYTSNKNGTQKSYNAKISGTTVTYTIPIADLGGKNGNYTVHIYAYDTKENCGTGATTFDFYNPTGTLDSCLGGGGSVTLRGWAFDGNDTSKPVEMNVYIGGDAGTGEGHAFLANTSRPDVNKVHGCGDNHGFSVTLSTKKTGTQDVYVYMQNIGHGGVKFLKKVTVTISPDSEKPLVKNTKVASFDSTSFTVTADVSDNVKVSKANFTVWMDGDKANTTKTFAGTISNGVATCKIKRSDVSSKNGKFVVQVYAYDAAGNYNVGETEYKCYAPKGSVEILEGSDNSIKVKGWAYDESNLSKSVQVQIIIGSDSNKEVYTITADKKRDDVNKVHGCGAYHGFETTLNTKFVGNQIVTVGVKDLETGVASTLKIAQVNIKDAPKNIVGNVNNDEGLDVDDVTYFQMFLAGYMNSDGSVMIETSKADVFKNADANGDGSIDVNDVTYIQMVIAGIIK